MLELVDPEPETVVLEPEIAARRFEAIEHYSYKDSDTQGVASSRTCWHQKLDGNLLDSQSGPCESYILVTGY
jgi:hypothetical protein